MKSLKYFVISLFAILSIASAHACFIGLYSPQGYYIYRINADKEVVKNSLTTLEQNCIEWQKITSDTIPTEDIMQIVYQMPLQQFEEAYDNPNQSFDNSFLEWISKHDREIMDFLLLAKTNEVTRKLMVSQWYYPTMRMNTRMSIEEIVERSLSHTTPRLRDRYLLQAVRALFTLERYEECIKIWNDEGRLLPKSNPLRDLMQDYIAGAELHLQNHKEAVLNSIERGDINSAIYYAKLGNIPYSSIECLEMVCEYKPNSEQIPATLQTLIHKWEPEGSLYDKEKRLKPTKEVKQLYALCQRMGQNPQCEAPAMWYYSAAVIADLLGNTNEAVRMLSLAEGSKSTPFIDESIAVFRIYLDAKTLPYDNNYEHKLFEQLKWLDNKIASNIDSEVIKKTANEAYYLHSCSSYYYWNDMMRRIVLGEVCPRMLKAGKTNRALQLANMASNHLLNIINKQEYYDYHYDENGDFHSQYHKCTMEEYRKQSKHNGFDFCSHFFILIDTLSADNAAQYVADLTQKGSEFDQFLNERGYINSDYLNDIVGTKMLREMRYAEAIDYLQRVSPSHRLNTNLSYNPFAITQVPATRQDRFKVRFAQRMSHLEMLMESTQSPNIKALCMYYYSIGLRNSFYYCWSLTQYYYGSLWCAPPHRNWIDEPHTQRALARVQQLTKEACQTATNPKVAAYINYELCNFRTVATMYPDTPQGQLVRGECDKLIDYHAERQSY